MSAPTAEPSSVLQQAINFINSEFGDNIKSLTKARQLSEQIKTTQTSLKKQVRFNVRKTKNHTDFQWSRPNTKSVATSHV